MNAVIVIALLAWASGQGTITRAPGVPSAAPAGPEVEVKPDVVQRGKTERIVVITDVDLEAPVTVEIQPPTGVRVRAIGLARSRAGGTILNLELTVDSNADPGERQIIVVREPAIVTRSPSRPGANDELTRAMEALVKAPAEDDVERVEIGSVYVNSHDLAIASVTPRKDVISIRVTDPVGDFEPPPGTARPAYSGVIRPLTSSSGVIVSELRCRDLTSLDAIHDARVTERQGSIAVIEGVLSWMPESGPCELRVRARDGAGNTSAWFTATVGSR